MVQTISRYRPGTITHTATGVLLALALLFVAAAPASADYPERPAGSPVMSDYEAATKVWRAGYEVRWDNVDENRRVPTAAELYRFYGENQTWNDCHRSKQRRITGNFTGTTDEILQWASQKWGLPFDLVRAVAATESWYHMSQYGDNGDSHGIMQVRASAHRGTWPLSRISTAFNVDYWGAHIRQYLDGCADWMRQRGNYGAGDLYRSIGAWVCGCWGGGDWYSAKVWAARYSKPWNSREFLRGNG